MGVRTHRLADVGLGRNCASVSVRISVNLPPHDPSRGSSKGKRDDRACQL
jgi:hypothetical protein